MKDIQSLKDYRKVGIKRVGIKDFHIPFIILEKSGSHQQVLANVSLSVDLSSKFKGTHLSRFVEIINEWSKKSISSRKLLKILKQTCRKLKSSQAQIVIKFKYFIKKYTPVSRKCCYLDYDCEFTGILDRNAFIFILGVDVPIHALCPCSKEISSFGAHNQRGLIKARVHYKGPILWIEDLVGLLEGQASSPVYPLLKREDEKYITEQAYKNPKFVEDILRDVVLALRKKKKIKWFESECLDFESIHNHNAFAYQEERN